MVEKSHRFFDSPLLAQNDNITKLAQHDGGCHAEPAEASHRFFDSLSVAQNDSMVVVAQHDGDSSTPVGRSE